MTLRNKPLDWKKLSRGIDIHEISIDNFPFYKLEEPKKDDFFEFPEPEKEQEQQSSQKEEKIEEEKNKEKEIKYEDVNFLNYKTVWIIRIIFIILCVYIYYILKRFFKESPENIKKRIPLLLFSVYGI